MFECEDCGYSECRCYPIPRTYGHLSKSEARELYYKALAEQSKPKPEPEPEPKPAPAQKPKRTPKIVLPMVLGVARDVTPGIPPLRSAPPSTKSPVVQNHLANYRESAISAPDTSAQPPPSWNWLRFGLVCVIVALGLFTGRCP